MIAKRVGAVALAITLIVGAFVIRREVIDDNESGDNNGDDSKELVCASEFRDVCRSVAVELGDDVTVTIADVGVTLDALTTADQPTAMWLTFAPFPEMADVVRTAHGGEPLDATTTTLASSPLAVVVRTDRSDELVAACGDPVELACLADQPQLSPTFAPIATGLGTLGVAAAAASYGDGQVMLGDVAFLVWARRLEGAGASSLSGGTAVQTIQTRPTFAVAIGAEAELADAQRDAFDVLYADPMTSVAVVLTVPDRTDPPDDLIPALNSALLDAGWVVPATSDPSGLPDATTILGVREFWKGLD